MDEIDLEELWRVRGFGVIPVSFMLLGVSLLFMLFPVIDIFTPFIGGTGMVAFLIDYKRLRSDERNKLIISVVIYAIAVFVFFASIVITVFSGVIQQGNLSQPLVEAHLKMALMVAFGCSALFQLAYMILPLGIARPWERTVLISSFVLYCALAGFVIYIINSGRIYLQLLPGSGTNSFGYNLVNFQLARLAIAPGLIAMSGIYLVMGLRLYRESQQDKTRLV